MTGTTSVNFTDADETLVQELTALTAIRYQDYRTNGWLQVHSNMFCGFVILNKAQRSQESQPSNPAFIIGLHLEPIPLSKT